MKRRQFIKRIAAALGVGLLAPKVIAEVRPPSNAYLEDIGPSEIPLFSMLRHREPLPVVGSVNLLRPGYMLDLYRPSTGAVYRILHGEYCVHCGTRVMYFRLNPEWVKNKHLAGHIEGTCPCGSFWFDPEFMFADGKWRLTPEVAARLSQLSETAKRCVMEDRMWPQSQPVFLRRLDAK